MDPKERLQRLEQTRIELTRQLKDMVGNEPNYQQVWDERVNVIYAINEIKRNLENQKAPKNLIV